MASSLASAKVPSHGMQGWGEAGNRQVGVRPGEFLGWLRSCLQTTERGAGNAEQAWVMGWRSLRLLGVQMGRKVLIQSKVWEKPFLPGVPRAKLGD